MQETLSTDHLLERLKLSASPWEILRCNSGGTLQISRATFGLPHRILAATSELRIVSPGLEVDVGTTLLYTRAVDGSVDGAARMCSDQCSNW